MPNDPKPNKRRKENNSFSPLARHNARRYALQAMYQWQVADTSLFEIETEFLLYQIDKPVELEFFKELIHGIPAHLDELDQLIAPSVGRPLQEIDPIELAVLRIAVFELIKRPDIPYRVIINEALVLTKKFGSIEGHKFINGVLDRIAHDTRAVEIKMATDKKEKNA